MRKSALATAFAVAALVLLGGCAAMLTVGAAAITAAAPTLGCASVSSSSSPAVAPSCPPEALTVAGVFVDPLTIHAPDALAAQAVAAALTAVSRGGRYIPEGNGPVNFDCSGLTAWAWRQAGIFLADLSYTQRDQTQDIPRSMVQPGDLVFWFGGDVHHVAIVVAVDGGQITIAEAANPQAGIRTRVLGGGWDDAYLSGFGRVVRR
jgi:cell wall-associated NlpC family hydrolase